LSDAPKIGFRGWKLWAKVAKSLSDKARGAARLDTSRAEQRRMAAIVAIFWGS